MGSLMQELTAMNVGYPIICGTMIHPSPDIMDTGVYIAVGTAVRCASSHVNVNSFSMAVAIFFLAIQLG